MEVILQNYRQKPPLPQVSVPQHCEEVLQLAPWPEQLVPLPHTPPEQVAVPQHWDELVHEAPTPLQPVPPEQMPPEQLSVPQHWEELVHDVPAPWQRPPEQTLFELQVSTPQQSPLEPQRWFSDWQGPTRFGSGFGSEGGEPHASARSRGRASRYDVLEGVITVSLSPMPYLFKP
jgi:hypothetical protein